MNRAETHTCPDVEISNMNKWVIVKALLKQKKNTIQFK